MPEPTVVLASGSPQRRRLLERLGIQFEVRAPDVAEIEQGEDPAGIAVENALRKARAALADLATVAEVAAVADLAGVADAAAGHESAPEDAREQIVIGCDTIVVLDGVIYGKPPDAAAARRTLAALGGRTHEVLSGLAVLGPARSGARERATRERTALARTRVTFRAIDEALLDWYVATEEWRGRSGGYAIQGAGAKLAARIEGEAENVVGLPLRPLLELCPELQIRWQP